MLSLSFVDSDPERTWSAGALMHCGDRHALAIVANEGTLMTVGPVEPQLHKSQLHKSRLVTAAAIVLLSLGSFMLALCATGNAPLVASFLFFCVGVVLFWSGWATIKRLRGWRIWAGAASWLMIVFTVWAAAILGDARYYPMPLAEALERWAITLTPGAVGSFVLWAKRRGT